MSDAKTIRLIWIFSTLFIVALIWTLTSPFSQDLVYHQFADQRHIQRIPNALDVLSNLAFCLVGVWGMVLIYRRTDLWSRESSVIYFVFFFGVFLTGFGSAYYHWSPENATLVWDRLPMTIAFMAFTCLIISERIQASLGYRMLPWLLFAGALSVGYWAWQDDLRPYIAVQFGPMLILPYIIWRYEGPGTRWLWWTFIFYLVAKILEHFDHQLYQLTGNLASGHTLKHLVAALGAYMIILKVQRFSPET